MPQLAAENVAKSARDQIDEDLENAALEEEDDSETEKEDSKEVEYERATLMLRANQKVNASRSRKRRVVMAV